MYSNHKTNYQAGDPFSAEDLNKLMSDVNELASLEPSSSDPHIVFDAHTLDNPTGKSNLTIQTTVEDLYLDGSKTKGGKLNLEPISDLLIKSGDDVVFCSHHREDPTEVSVKVLDGNDNPVKLLLNMANIVLTTKDKNKTKQKDANGDDTSTALYDDPNVLNITVNSNKNTRGYLKVRAQAIDLRSESHGGIALQPKGYDNPDGTKFDGDPTITDDDISNNRVRYMNKIKFEHGGGDGLEFGTFNSEKSSLYTKEYRFNKDGKILLATRNAVERLSTDADYSLKYDANDPTTHYYYQKQTDDFYDVIYKGPSGNELYDYDPTDVADTSITWEDLIKLVSYFKKDNFGPFDDGSDVNNPPVLIADIVAAVNFCKSANPQSPA